MGARLHDKVAIVTGAGQAAGDTIGNGRAISLLFAREGAKVLLADYRLDSALETKTLIEKEQGEASAFRWISPAPLRRRLPRPASAACRELP